MNEPNALFDPGLQPERTLLAWQRTCLALAVVIAGGTRLAMPVLGAPIVVLGTISLALLTFSWLGTIHRYRGVHRSLTGSQAALQQSGCSLAVLAGATSIFGLGGFAFVLFEG
ncbi:MULTISPECIES: DUF202 domain-containing protein [Micrococcaceae]|uniref:DUF202 domain-containing protein n=1 Tax=unclassified Kocuria TaxID=2649579 RepID=UPI0010132FE1|nr:MULTISPECIES: DUF202 domain-containing protein [unclassified Kocuria]